MRRARIVAVMVSLVAATVVLAACSSSPAHPTALMGSKTQQECTAVSDVLSDGPDPDADAVGYAQAQVLPLEQLKISEPKLAAAVKNLAAAYQTYSSTSGTAQDEAAVQTTQAEKALNAICPGAAP